MVKTLKVMCVHGLGDQRLSAWQSKWETGLNTAFPIGEEFALDYQFVTYDDIFANLDQNAFDYAAAAAKLAVGGLASMFRRRGIFTDLAERVRWTAGYVVAWVENEAFQAATRKLILDAVREGKPDIVLAHSLGSLITYDAFGHDDAAEPGVAKLLAKLQYVTFGSQLGNPFVMGNLVNGRLLPLKVDFWHHLYNVHDNVFTAQISLPDMLDFRQTETPFDDDGIADHSAVRYLTHESAISNVWRSIARSALETAPERRRMRSLSVPAAKSPVRKKQKALLVGINDYPDPKMRLEGCVNDVFQMSATLQQCGVPANDIRVCLDDRATAEGIKSRLEWLLDDPKPNDELIFYYSGHGARVPEYGANLEPDQHIETLVPWDFDWTPERYIADDQIFGLYSQLPYDTRFVMIFDCCHSGGLHRDGRARPRAITPPDDIRHRELKWDSKAEMWVQRDFQRMNRGFSTNRKDVTEFFGADGATSRLGRGAAARKLTQKQYEDRKKNMKDLAPGPYLPLIIEACGEAEFSYEYKHGATSYGAFTFSLTTILRRQKRGQKLNFRDLVEQTRLQLAELGYDQTPNILGPNFMLDHPIPWTPGG
jgi:metacaspase-1